jgi:protein-tyrosine phosphatase
VGHDERSLGLTGAPNARDLGGLPTSAGGKVRTGLVYRASALGRLTDADVAALDRLGLVDVVDLRHGSEIEVAPPDRLPAGPHLAHIPIFDPAHPVFTYVSAVLLGQDLSAYAGLAAQGTPGAMLAIYRWFVSSADARAGFAAAVRRVAGTSGPVLFHCSAGKDRTGWLSAILLGALGVDRAAITADYLLTNKVQARINETILTAITSRRGVDEQAVRPVLTVAPEYLDAAFAEAARCYGTFDGYLRAGLGLDDETLERLRVKLLG